jgi:hypothetical protein
MLLKPYAASKRRFLWLHIELAPRWTGKLRRWRLTELVPQMDSTEIPFECALALEKAEKRDEKAIRHAGD